MKAIPIVFVSCIFAIGLSEGFKSSGKVTLDVTHVDSFSINVLTRRLYEMVTHIYTAKDGHRISSIVDGDAILWISDGHSCDHVVVIFGKTSVPSSVLVYTKDGVGVQSCLHLERVGSEWVSVTEEAFYRRFHAKMLKEVTFDSIDLDISQKRTIRLYVTNSPKLPFLIYVPKVGYRIKKVKDGLIASLWSAKSEDENCTYASFYPRELPILAYLIVSDPGVTRRLFFHKMGASWHEVTRRLFFHKMGASWHEVTREVYMDKLTDAGFNLEELDDRATLDLRDADKHAFHKHAYILSDYFEHLYRPLPGYLNTKVVDDGVTVWEASDGEHCLYVGSAVKGVIPMMCYLFVVDANNNKKILYHINDGSGWELVDKDTYYTFLTRENDPAYTHEGRVHGLVTSSFRNRQGLRLTSYASEVDNAKGDIILIHGFRSYFKADFGRYNYEWNFENLGFPSSPNARKLFVDDEEDLQKTPSFAHRYKHIFEHATQSAFDAFEMTHKFEHNGGFVVCLNRLGYNVYGMDLQSQGLSEASKPFRCYANDFKDHVYDVMQFVSIIKRGKFDDASQVYDEQSIFENIESERKLILICHSMGGNIALQTVQEFYRHAKPDTPFVDGVVLTSGMLNLDHHLNTFVKKLMRRSSKFLLWLVPHETTRYERLPDSGESFDMLTRYYDPFFHSGWTVIKTNGMLFDASDDVHKEENMKYYPKDLPTLFLHAEKDFMCDVKGPRDMMDKYFKDSKVAKLVELGGTCHYLTVAQAASHLILRFKDWLHNTPKRVSVSKGVTIQSDEL